MILVCPNCSARYLVQSNSIEVGKKVRCASCKNTWIYEEPVEEVQDDIELELQDIDADAPDYDDIDTGSNIPDLTDDDFVPSAVKPNAYNSSSLSFSNDRSALVTFLLLGGIFIVFSIIFVLSKDFLYKKVPGIEAVYSVIGMGIQDSSAVLVFDQLAFEQGDENAHVVGTIINLSNDVQGIPYIEMAMLDENGVVISDLSYINLPNNVIAAEEVLTFKIPVSSVSQDATEVELRFVSQAKGTVINLQER